MGGCHLVLPLDIQNVLWLPLFCLIRLLMLMVKANLFPILIHQPALGKTLKAIIVLTREEKTVPSPDKAINVLHSYNVERQHRILN